MPAGATNGVGWKKSQASGTIKCGIKRVCELSQDSLGKVKFAVQGLKKQVKCVYVAIYMQISVLGKEFLVEMFVESSFKVQLCVY